MNRITLILTFFIAAMSVVPAQAEDAHKNKSHGTGHASAHWTYEGASGPSHWGDLDEKFKVCREGRSQSPIDIIGAKGGDADKLEFHYNTSSLNIVHNGHTVQVNVGYGSTLNIGEEKYELLQFHFHTPSEHAVDGQRSIMEAHFVHKNAHGGLAVVGVLMEKGPENTALANVFEAMPSHAGKPHDIPGESIEIENILPEDHTALRYNGSLTTPPCSEGVRWFVLAKPVSVSAKQAEKFHKAVGENARPLQALHGRHIIRN